MSVLTNDTTVCLASLPVGDIGVVPDHREGNLLLHAGSRQEEVLVQESGLAVTLQTGPPSRHATQGQQANHQELWPHECLWREESSYFAFKFRCIAFSRRFSQKRLLF